MTSSITFRMRKGRPSAHRSWMKSTDQRAFAMVSATGDARVPRARLRLLRRRAGRPSSRQIRRVRLRFSTCPSRRRITCRCRSPNRRCLPAAPRSATCDAASPVARADIPPMTDLPRSRNTPAARSSRRPGRDGRRSRSWRRASPPLDGRSLRAVSSRIASARGRLGLASSSSGAFGRPASGSSMPPNPAFQAWNVAPPIPCLRRTSAVFAPASCSRRIAMIGPSVTPIPSCPALGGGRTPASDGRVPGGAQGAGGSTTPVTSYMTGSKRVQRVAMRRFRSRISGVRSMAMKSSRRSHCE